MKLFNRVSRCIRTQSRKRPPVRLSFDLFEERLLLTTFTVNSAADPFGLEGTTTLRQAIDGSNATPGPDTIDFNIPGPGVHTISLASPLPPITDPVTIDGYSQGGTPNSSAVGTNANILVQLNLNGNLGLVFNPPSEGVTGSAGSRVQGLSIYGGSGAAIDINANNVTVAGNFLGIQADGATVAANVTGVNVAAGVTEAQIGSAALADRNLISGNSGDGIAISGDGNFVQGNKIGTNAAGTAALGNGISGVGAGVRLGGASNMIANNVISGNVSEGIFITAGGNMVLGNLIGTNAAGTAPLGNGLSGITVQGSSGNTISGNTISGNGTSTAGGNGIILTAQGANQNLIQGNFIGTDSAGVNALPNHDGGIGVIDGQNNTIGGTGSGESNLISGNDGDGISISTASDNLVEGNKIGVDASGNRNLGNIANGVSIVSGSGNTIGGNVATAGNAIAFNGGNAVVVDTGTGNAVLSNSIHDNRGGGIVLTNGGNNDQAAPALTDALLYSDRINVDGSLDVAAGTSYIVQYFGNNPASGQGQTLLGSQAISTQPANGTVTLSFTASPLLPAGSTITAVASVTAPPDSIVPALGDTSAFSTAAVLVNPFIVTNTNDSGIGSLRQAILYSNANPGLDTITFNIPGAGLHIISPGSPLPDLVDPVVIDATTQPGFDPSNPRPVIELNGADAGTGASGFTIDTQEPLSRAMAVIAGGSTIRGLVINQFGGYGILIDSGNNLINGDWIGTNANGTAALGNGLDGIFLSNSAGNTISGNLISGNGINQDAAGIDLESNDSNNVIAGNKIGTNAAGDAMLGNSLHGIFLGNGSSNNTIGGPTDNDRNVISGNGQFPVADLATQGGVGVYIFGANTSGNVVQHNYIGTNAAGIAALTNSVIGVLISQSFGNTVQGNLISGNRLIGLEIAGGTASGNLVQGNKIGTNFDGTTAIPNGLDGVFISDAPNNTIGGTAAGAGNLISGNGSVGIQLFGPLTRGNVVEGNALGLNSAGQPTLPNRAGGIFVNTGPLNNQVGGTAPDQTNRGQTRQQLTVTGFHQSHAGSKTRHTPPAGRRFRIRGRARTSLRTHSTAH